MRLQRGNRGMRFVRQSQRPSDDEGLIPLINVIFLILIFFMILGHMEAAAPFPLAPPASHTDNRPSPDQLTLLLAADGRIAVGHEVLDGEALELWLKRWMQSVSGASDNAPPPKVSVKADAQVQAQELRSLLNTLQSAGFRKIRLLTDLAH